MWRSLEKQNRESKTKGIEHYISRCKNFARWNPTCENAFQGAKFQKQNFAHLNPRCENFAPCETLSWHTSGISHSPNQFSNSANQGAKISHTTIQGAKIFVPCETPLWHTSAITEMVLHRAKQAEYPLETHEHHVSPFRPWQRPGEACPHPHPRRCDHTVCHQRRHFARCSAIHCSPSEGGTPSQSRYPTRRPPTDPVPPTTKAKRPASQPPVKRAKFSGPGEPSQPSQAEPPTEDS
ncbi:hypothetical protein CK203_111443 [Vitis vinifera]|uniref:Uncharacterized protein n=1 Tax=Vitis vinifera TaxID=29760 RepID=A0A438CBK2_VITVI|nr:hypothetical protein CK203_111443 [Vitis vinifera]